jgi:hypothetical protein
VIAAAVLAMIAAPAMAQIPAGASDTDNIGFRGTYWGSRGPYRGVVYGTGVPFFSGGPGAYLNVDMVCTDAYNYVSSGDTWRANFSRMSISSDINTYTRFGMNQAPPLPNLNGYTVQERYWQAAWLSTRMTIDNRDAVHTAIWNLFRTGPTSTGYLGWIEAAEAWADGGYGGFNSDYWYVATDVTTEDLVDVNGSTQEYIVHVTPEPATLILMGTGLVAVIGMTVVMRQSVG